MATVIDELTLRLGLDASQFHRAQDEFQRNLRKVQDETGTRGKDIEAAGQKMADTFHRIRNEVVALAAVLLGVRGLKEFAATIVDNEAAVGRWARIIGISTEDLSSFGNAAETVGGSMSETTQALNGLQQKWQALTKEGNTAVLPYFQALGIKLTDAHNNLRPIGDLLTDLHRRFQTLIGPEQQFYGQALGLGQGLTNLLGMKDDQYNAAMEMARKNATTPAEAQAGQNLISSITTLHQTMEKFGRMIGLDVEPYVTKLVTTMTELIIANRGWIAQAIAEKVKQFGDYIKAIDWAAVKKDIEDFFAKVNTVVTALGGWQTVTEGLIALWTVNKFSGAFVVIALLISRLGPLALLVAGIAGAWALISSANENLSHPENWAAGSPFWSGMSEADQLGYPNSPASQKRNGTGGSLFDRGMNWLTGGAPPAEGTPAGDIAKRTHDFWRAQGYTETQTAGILAGGPGAESGFNPNSWGDDHTSYGMYQFHADRLAGLQARYGPNATVDQQNEYYASELAPGGIRAAQGARLRSATTLNEATQAMTDSEGPKNPFAGLLRSRQAPAYVGKYDGSGSGGVSPVAGSGAVPLPLPPLPPAAFNSSNTDNRNYAQSNTESNFSPTIHIYTQATDSEGIARGVAPALRKYAFAIQSNSGLA